MNDHSDPLNEGSVALTSLFALLERAGKVSNRTELDFMAVNNTHLLARYTQAVLWTKDDGAIALSGVSTVDRNAPYVQWINKVCECLPRKGARRIVAEDVPPAVAGQWSEWLGSSVLWVPFAIPSDSGAIPAGGLVFSRDAAWSDREVEPVVAWITAWALTRQAVDPLVRKRRGWKWPRTSIFRLGMLALAVSVMCLPVPLSVLAPGELVPAEPLSVRAPLDGVVSQFHVTPNQLVRAGDPLFSFDSIQLTGRLEVANQALATAEIELRQLSQQALADPKARAQLAAARGNVTEKRAELDYLRGQRGRTRVLALEDGVALFDDPHEWIGKPVVTGERIMRIASEHSKEIEAWVALGDAIELQSGSPARLYLSGSPLEPVSGMVRYLAHDATKRPDGGYAYRVRAILESPTEHRIGLRGTVRLSGDHVTLAFWVFRRPLAAIREFFGI